MERRTSSGAPATASTWNSVAQLEQQRVQHVSTRRSHARDCSGNIQPDSSCADSVTSIAPTSASAMNGYDQSLEQLPRQRAEHHLPGGGRRTGTCARQAEGAGRSARNRPWQLSAAAASSATRSRSRSAPSHPSRPSRPKAQVANVTACSCIQPRATSLRERRRTQLKELLNFDVDRSTTRSTTSIIPTEEPEETASSAVDVAEADRHVALDNDPTTRAAAHRAAHPPSCACVQGEERPAAERYR